MPIKASSRTSTGGRIGDEPLRREPVERQSIERERQAGGVADPVAEARAGHPRRPLHLEATDLEVVARLRQGRRLPDAPQLDDVVLGRAVRDVRVRRVRDAQRERVALLLRLRERLLGRLELRLDALELAQLLRRGLSLQLRARPQLVDPRDERPPALVRLEEAVERVCGALAREGGARLVRVRASSLEVDHGTESRKASITAATPSRSGPGQVASAISRRRWMRALDRDAEAGHLEQLDVVLAVAERDDVAEVEPQLRRDERDPRALGDRRMAELEEVRQGRREEDAAREATDELGAGLREHVRLGDGDELRRRPVEPREQVAHLGHGQALEAGVRARVLGLARRRRARRRRRRWGRARAPRARRSPRARPRARAARGGGTRATEGRPRPRPGSRRPAPRSRPPRGTARPSGTSGRSRRGRGRRRPARA